MEFEEVVKLRTATRKFGNRKVGKGVLEKILNVGRLAPTAKNLQPQKIYVLQSEDSLNKVDMLRHADITLRLFCLYVQTRI